MKKDNIPKIKYNNEAKTYNVLNKEEETIKQMIDKSYDVFNKTHSLNDDIINPRKAFSINNKKSSTDSVKDKKNTKTIKYCNPLNHDINLDIENSKSNDVMPITRQINRQSTVSPKKVSSLNKFVFNKKKTKFEISTKNIENDGWLESLNNSSKTINNSKNVTSSPMKSRFIQRSQTIKDDFFNLRAEIEKKQVEFINKELIRKETINAYASKISEEKQLSSKHNNLVSIFSESKFHVTPQLESKSRDIKQVSESLLNSYYTESQNSSQNITLITNNGIPNGIDSLKEIRNFTNIYSKKDKEQFVEEKERLMIKYKNQVYDSLSDDEFILESDSYIIDPNSYYIKLLRYLILFFCFYSSIYTSVIVAYNFKPSLITIILDIIIDLLIIVSILLQFNIGYYDDEDNFIFNRKKIFFHYFKNIPYIRHSNWNSI